MSERLTTRNLAELLAGQTGLERKRAESFIEGLSAYFAQNLERNKVVKIFGLGVFKILLVRERESVHIQTGERFIIPAHHKMTFVPDKDFKEDINRPFSLFETIEAVEEDELLTVKPQYAANTLINLLDDPEEITDAVTDKSKKVEDILSAIADELNQVIDEEEYQVTDEEEYQVTVEEPNQVTDDESNQVTEMINNETIPEYSLDNIDYGDQLMQEYSLEDIENVEVEPQYPPESVENIEDIENVESVEVEPQYLPESVENIEDIENIENIEDIEDIEDIESVEDIENIESIEDEPQYPPDSFDDKEFPVTGYSNNDLDNEEQLEPEYTTDSVLLEELPEPVSAFEEADLNPVDIKFHFFPTDHKKKRVLIWCLVVMGMLFLSLGVAIGSYWFLHYNSPDYQTQYTETPPYGDESTFLELDPDSDELADEQLFTSDTDNRTDFVSDNDDMIVDTSKSVKKQEVIIVEDWLTTSPVNRTQETRRATQPNRLIEDNNRTLASNARQGTTPTSQTRTDNTRNTTTPTPTTTTTTPTSGTKPLSRSTTVKMRAGKTLTQYAEEYYGNKIFWVYIYEHNKGRISNPNNIPVGTSLQIPAAQTYGIDPNNPSSIEKATIKQRQYR